MRILLAAALALPLFTGCAQPSQSSSGGADSAGAPAVQPAPGGAQQVSVEVRQGEGASSTGEEQRAAAEGAAGGAVVRGTISTPNPCHRLSGAVQRSGTTVTVTISATVDPDVMCIASIGNIPYTATLRGLPAGRYTLRVLHTYPGTGWPTATALETEVAVR
jgi:hypothetical protein